MKRESKPLPRIHIVAREYDEFGRPELVLHPQTGQPISVDPLNPTEVPYTDFWARRLVDRSVTVVPLVQEKRTKRKPTQRPVETDEPAALPVKE